jgi:hypothetical protein
VSFDFARINRGRRPLFMAIAAVAVFLSGCVTEQRYTAVSRQSSSQVAVETPVPSCTVQDLRMALEAKERGYDYQLDCR